MRKFLFGLIVLYATSANAVTSFSCSNVGENTKRCENDEVVCYIYDSGWAGFAKSGRGAGISCLPVVKKTEPKPFFIMVPKDQI